VVDRDVLLSCLSAATFTGVLSRPSGSSAITDCVCSFAGDRDGERPIGVTDREFELSLVVFGDSCCFVETDDVSKSTVFIGVLGVANRSTSSSFEAVI
jgi:hypothetical protein